MAPTTPPRAPTSRSRSSSTRRSRRCPRSSSTRRWRCARKGEDDAYTILLDPSRIREDFGWEPKTPLEEGVRNAIDYYREHGIAQTYTHLKVRRDDAWAGSRAHASSSSAAPASSARTSCARCSTDAPREISWSTTCSPPSARTCPTTTACGFVEASINDDEVLAGAARATSTTSSTCRPTTATRARWRTRSPTTSTTR